MTESASPLLSLKQTEIYLLFNLLFYTYKRHNYIFMTDISNLHLLAADGSSIVAELAEEELQRRLSLYEVFLKLYKHHSSLLDKILQLEDVFPLGEKQQYIQAIENEGAVYVITNLCEGKTQSLQQPQQIWTIGRDRRSGIHVLDRYVSRRHAAIQYIQKKGFYLIDFGSKNGSYINDEQIYQPTKLQDGDRIRLGNMTFSFFINLSTQVLPSVAVELLMQLIPKRNSTEAASHAYYSTSKTKTVTNGLEDISRVSENTSVREQELCPLSSLEEQLSAHQKSEILDYFFNRHSSISSVVEE